VAERWEGLGGVEDGRARRKDGGTHGIEGKEEECSNV
jgi:hypothetical protein